MKNFMARKINLLDLFHMIILIGCSSIFLKFVNKGKLDEKVLANAKVNANVNTIDALFYSIF
jgi:hypothetical protein